MFTLRLIIFICWIIFWVYWFAKAERVKKTVAGGLRRRIAQEISFRLVIFIIIIGLFRISAHDTTTVANYHLAHGNLYIAGFGVVIFVSGLAIAIWARRNLGTNWGAPMALKKDPDLVTSGPYCYVRHPIYGGILLAMLGTTIASDLAWLFILLIAGIYFIYSATVEEKNMLKQFPKTYPDYKRKTKMLIPFVL